MDPIFYVEKAVDLRYLLGFPGARVFVSRIDKLSESKDIGLVLKNGVVSHGWVPVNLDQIRDAREIDYSLCALEQALEALLVADAVDEEALSVAVAVEEEALHYFTTRLSVARSVCDDEGVRAVVTAVIEVIRAARSPRVQGEDAVAEADRGRIVTAVRGVTRAVVTALRGVVRAARSPRVQGDDAVAARSPPVEGNRSVADLARAALGEVRTARARPVLLYHDLVPLHISSVQGAEEVLRAAPPHTRGVWNTARVLDVRAVVPLSDAGDLWYQLKRCSELGWRIPKMTEVGQARRLDAHLILLNYKLKSVFARSGVREDVSVDPLLLESIGKQTEELLRVCMEEIKMLQSEIATIPDIISKMVTNPSDAAMVRDNANKGMTIVRRIRSQQVRF